MNFLRDSRAPCHAEEIELVTHDQLKLYGRLWRCGAKPSATIVVVHGFGEHSGRYNHVAAWFCDAGMDAITFDLRGHGKSEGPRGHYSHYSDLIRDLELVLGRAESPKFLYAHSFGGQIVLRAGTEVKLPVLGAFISSPWIRLAFSPPAW